MARLRARPRGRKGERLKRVSRPRSALDRELIDRTLAIFSGANGFLPGAFTVATAEPGNASEGPLVTRSIRHTMDGACAVVSVHGSKTDASRRRIVTGLRRAGYEEWLKFEDETTCRRWLRGQRDRVAELRFLEGMDGDLAQRAWGKRGRVRPPRERRLTFETCASAIDEVRACGVPWDEYAITIGRNAKLPFGCRGEHLSVNTTVYAMEGVSERQLDVLVSVFSTVELPASNGTLREVSMELNKMRYKPVRAYDPHGGKKFSLVVIKRASRPEAALRECERVQRRLHRIATQSG
jgi:hypothetical protein